MFIESAVIVVGGLLGYHLFRGRDKAVYVRKSTLVRIQGRRDEEEAKAARDRRVYELARDLVDSLAEDTVCRHLEFWLGDRCRDCAIIRVKETVHLAMQEVK